MLLMLAGHLFRNQDYGGSIPLIGPVYFESGGIKGGGDSPPGCNLGPKPFDSASPLCRYIWGQVMGRPGRLVTP